DTLPATNFASARYTENFGRQNRIGILATAKSMGSYFNSVTAVDGFFRFGQAHSLNTMAIYSTTTGKEDGFSGYAQYFYTSNQFKFWLTESIVTKSFNPEVGFVSRQDVVATSPGFYWYYRGSRLPYKKLIRSFEPGVASEFYHSLSTHQLTERSVGLIPLWLNLQTGGFIGGVITPTYQRLTTNFEPLGVFISQGEYNYTRYSFQMGSNPSRKISYTFQYELGNYFNGNLNMTDFQFNFSPLPNITLRLRYNDNYFQKVGEQLVTKHVRLYTSQLRLALNPRIQLIGLFQRNTQSNTNAYNLRLSWEYKPLSYIYLVYNNRVNTVDATQSELNQIMKISYLKQF
ncbi:MAG TPA: hypothetical protein VIT44_03825, partial [Cyclobacteriaceae bacterium]